jgi:hypothetical protein
MPRPPRPRANGPRARRGSSGSPNAILSARSLRHELVTNIATYGYVDRAGVIERNASFKRRRSRPCGDHSGSLFDPLEVPAGGSGWRRYSRRRRWSRPRVASPTNAAGERRGAQNVFQFTIKPDRPRRARSSPDDRKSSSSVGAPRFAGESEQLVELRLASAPAARALPNAATQHLAVGLRFCTRRR